MNFKPNEQRAKTAQVFLWIIVGLYALSLVSTFFEYQLINSWRNGVEVDINSANMNDQRQRAIAVLQILAWIGSGISFIMWFRRAYYNLNKKENMRYTDGWAAGGWFVPFLNLWRPFQIMKEMYQTANKILSVKNPFNAQPLRLDVLGIWWFAWILNNILGRISYQLTTKAESLVEFINASLFDMVATGWGLATALLAIKVVRDYASVEPLLFTEESNSAKAVFDEEIPEN
jgi:hypothetical protein